MVTVVNLMKPENKQYYSCSPREAVVAAYAQSLHDWNTWDYPSRYDEKVEASNLCFICGDFCAYKDGREF